MPSIYEEKYQTDKIENVLIAWEKWKDTEVEDDSVDSTFLLSRYEQEKARQDHFDDDKISTNIIYLKYRKTDSFAQALRHWFLDINNEYRWDPGAQDITILAKFENVRNTHPHIMYAMYELCDKCTYKYLLKNFCKDSSFNIFFYNCELILGNFFQTFLLTTSIILMIISFIFKSPLFLILCCGALMLYFISSKLNSNDFFMKKCRHVKSNIVNIKNIDI